MNNYEELKGKFPKMYENVSCGCSHPSSWNKLVMKLSAAINEIDKENKIRVVQTKEKYAALRFYTECVPSEINKTVEVLIAFAEELSTTICQRCGNGGKVREHGAWYWTLCDDCDDKRRNPRGEVDATL